MTELELYDGASIDTSSKAFKWVESDSTRTKYYLVQYKRFQNFTFRFIQLNNIPYFLLKDVFVKLRVADPSSSLSHFFVTPEAQLLQDQLEILQVNIADGEGRGSKQQDVYVGTSKVVFEIFNRSTKPEARQYRDELTSFLSAIQEKHLTVVPVSDNKLALIVERLRNEFEQELAETKRELGSMIHGSETNQVELQKTVRLLKSDVKELEDIIAHEGIPYGLAEQLREKVHQLADDSAQLRFSRPATIDEKKHIWIPLKEKNGISRFTSWKHLSWKQYNRINQYIDKLYEMNIGL